MTMAGFMVYAVMLLNSSECLHTFASFHLPFKLLITEGLKIK
jgi:hypothetical protein